MADEENRRRRGRTRLKVKITLMILSLMLCLFLATNGYIINKVYNELVGRERLLGITYAELLANNSEEALIGGDDLSLAKFINQVNGKPGVKYAIIMDNAGKILAHSQYQTFYGTVFGEFRGIAAGGSEGDIRRFRLAADEPSYKSSAGDEGEEVLDISRPVIVRFSGQEGKPIGSVRVGISLDAIRGLVVRTMIQFVLVSSAAIILGIFGSISLAEHIVKPIRMLVSGVKSIGEGNFDQRIDFISSDEIGDLTASFNRMAQSLKEKEFIKATFSSYVTKQVADLILNNPEKAGVQGERRNISIMFADIRSFTSMAEKTDAQKVVNLLNFYFSMMVDMVIRFDGTIDKFLGDAMMALFGAPVPSENHAVQAVGSALAIKETMDLLNAKLKERGHSPIRIGIGINSGDAIVGNIGSEGKKMEYTAIGDNVNVAQRLQAVAQNNNVIISHSTYEMVKGLFVIEPKEAVMVKGKEKPVVIYEVLGRLKSAS